MCRVLAAGDYSVVATDAVTSDTIMFECGARPGVGPVAIIANVTAPDVTRVFALRGEAIVATLAGTDDSKVVDSHHCGPGNCLVAVFTARGHANMLARRWSSLDSARI